MAAFVSPSLNTLLDGTHSAEEKGIPGEASLTVYIVHREVFTSRQLALIDADNPLLELHVVIPRGIIDRADAAVEAAGSQKVAIDFHRLPP